LIVADQPDQKQPGTTLAFQQALTQAVELWDKTPVAILDQQAVQTHALLLAMGKYITYRKGKRGARVVRGWLRQARSIR
jgi:hypothetical protein